MKRETTMSRVGSSPSAWVWAMSALGSVALHAGLAALAIKYLASDDYDELGAPAIVIDVELLAPRREAFDLPVGPDVEASVAAPVVVRKDTVEPTVPQRDITDETEEPDRVVAPIERKKPVQEEPDQPTVPVLATQASLAAEVTAPPSLETIEKSLRSVAPAGTGVSAERVRATWEKDLIAHLDRHKRYPVQHSLPSATILVNFVLDKDGHVLAAKIVAGSGDASFDDAALRMIRRADPVPKPPAVVVSAGLDFTLPVNFKASRTN